MYISYPMKAAAASIHDGRLNYPVEWWVMKPHTLKKGDKIAFYSKRKGREIKAYVIDVEDDTPGGEIIFCEEIGTGERGMIDCYDSIIYLLKDNDNRVCTCGAKHTSTPGFHLSYCDLGKRK